MAFARLKLSHEGGRLFQQSDDKTRDAFLACVQITAETGEQQVLRQLARIIDPDFGQDIVSCGFVKDLQVTPRSGQVAFALELTTPACPIKDEFERKARKYVLELPWVQQVSPFCKSLHEPTATSWLFVRSSEG